MTLFWLLALLFLAAAFGVLVWTFVWVARLLARRADEAGRGADDAESATAEDRAQDEGDEDEQGAEGDEDGEVESDEDREEGEAGETDAADEADSPSGATAAGPRERQATTRKERERAAAERAHAERAEKRRGTGVNSTLGLILGVLACALFWLSPLTLAVSLAGVYFSAIALWTGLRTFGVLIGRAVAGVALSLSSVALVYGYHFANTAVF